MSIVSITGSVKWNGRAKCVFWGRYTRKRMRTPKKTEAVEARRDSDNNNLLLAVDDIMSWRTTETYLFSR